MLSDQKLDKSVKPIIGTWWSHIRAALVLVFISCNLAFWIVPLLVLVLIKGMLPISWVRARIYKIMAWIYRIAVDGNSWILFNLLKIRLDITGIDHTYPGNFYLILSNHQSWSDIFILQHLLNRKAPIMKFLVKQELMYLPLVGVICWAYDFPFLNRGKHRKRKTEKLSRVQDSQTLSKSLTRFLRSSAAIMNFAEGTRFSHPKAVEQRSPHQYLLKPKAGGLIAIYKMVCHNLTAVLDFTIVYHAPKLSFWRFISGSIPRVSIHVDTISSQELKENFGLPETNFKPDRAIEWVNQMWRRKDKQIHHILSANF